MSVFIDRLEVRAPRSASCATILLIGAARARITAGLDPDRASPAAAAATMRRASSALKAV